MKMRIYAQSIGEHSEILADLPEKMKTDVKKAGDCKKLNGMTCSPTCSGGYSFTMDGEELKKLEYIKDCSTGIETISYEKVNISYPKHTHIGHVVFGIVTNGTVGVKIDQEDFICNNGEMFSIAPNVPHSVYPITDYYSMISICLPEEDHMDRELNIIKKEIIGNPELEISIADMSEKVHISPYHMIRKFACENGLTPHKFQLQCRIRKAQELLENGMKVVDVAAAVGFCDQSHLCRAFKKQMGITPEEYINSAILYKSGKK